VKRTTFPTPQDAEAAFYEAIERIDLEAMMEVWSDDDEVSCIHPGGERVCGYEQVRESWSQIFGSRQRLQVRLSDQVIVTGMMYSVHSVHENILVQDGEGRGARSVVVTTNVYVRSSNGWRMVLHHGSPVQATLVRHGTATDEPKVLH
jgi:ketosteroid isomerase-like protein